MGYMTVTKVEVRAVDQTVQVGVLEDGTVD